MFEIMRRMCQAYVKCVVFLAIWVSMPSQAAVLDPQAFVSSHNKWRAEVGVAEKLTYSPTLATSAQNWANHLKLTNRCEMRHSKPKGKYGENLFWGSALTWSDGSKELQKVTPEQVVDAWGSEKVDYDYAKNSCTPGKMCGHYTQMVWRSTSQVGCAMAVCQDTKQQIWVCQYQPAGNWVGKKPY